MGLGLGLGLGILGLGLGLGSWCPRPGVPSAVVVRGSSLVAARLASARRAARSSAGGSEEGGSEEGGGEAAGGEAGARLSAGSGHACDHGLARHGSDCARPGDEGRAAARDTRAASARRAGTRVAASRVW